MLKILAITAPIYIAIAIGFLSVRFELFTKAEMRVLGKFVINLALPCLLFNALAQRNIQEILNSTYMLAYAAGSLLTMGIAFLWFRCVERRDFTTSTYRAMGACSSNSAYVGFPILLLILPSVAGVALALNVIVENLLVLPILLVMADSSANAGSDWRQTLGQMARRLISNPLVIALLLGVAVSLVGLSLPVPLARTVNLFAQASSAISLLVIGGVLHGLPFGGIGRQVVPVVIGKLLLHPMAVALAFSACLFLGMHDLAGDLRHAAILMAAMPVMGIYPLLAQRHGHESSSAAILLATTVFSFITLNALIWWFQVLPV